jgi:acetoacetate decarboxylase
MIFIMVMSVSFNSFAQNFDGTTLSSTNPYYGEPPYQFEGSVYYFISFKSDSAVVRALVPEPLTPIPNAEITIVFAKQNAVEPKKLFYHEVFIMIPAMINNIVGGYMPVLYLNKVAGILPGREIWGYNKVDADIQFKEDGNKVSVTVTQLDTLLIKASFTLGELFVPPAEEKILAGTINLKYIPSVLKDAPSDIKQLTLSPTKDNTTTKMQLGKATLEFYQSHYNPLDKIPIMEITKAGCTVNSFTLVHGKVLYDYLKED